MECETSVGGKVERITLRLEGMDVDFKLAEELSKLLAAKKGLDMVIAWYDPERNVHFPNVECCGEDEPAWYIYGKSRGGKLLIEVQGYEFFFI